MDERRQHPRVPVSRTATVRTPDGQAQRVQLVDLSVSGLGLLMPQPAHAGEVLDINFHLSHGAQSLFIDVQGTIRRSHIRGAQYVVGIEIQQIQPEAANLISSFVRYKLELGGHLRPEPGAAAARSI